MKSAIVGMFILGWAALVCHSNMNSGVKENFNVYEL